MTEKKHVHLATVVTSYTAKLDSNTGRLLQSEVSSLKAAQTLERGKLVLLDNQEATANETLFFLQVRSWGWLGDKEIHRAGFFSYV